MTELQKFKAKFRASKKWKEFRSIIYKLQNGRCPICGMKLSKTANLHHKDLNPAHYTDVSNPNNFVFLCNSCHDYIHYKYKAFVRGDFNFENLIKVFSDMKQLNN